MNIEAPTHCTCDDHSDDSYCCNCGHFHSSDDCPAPGPCGDYRCCIN